VRGEDERTPAGLHEIGAHPVLGVGEGHTCRRVGPADLAVHTGVAECGRRIPLSEGRVAQGVLAVVAGDDEGSETVAVIGGCRRRLRPLAF